ncbi:hypothetical protein QVD17_23659 [Tagetes erecta]|uniref:Uncharacterized protein n=1 Tax=Tagetes erecta TaxID=13708 RepID=A0AAD8KET8_TARER|nr:hypothetical protein QVD17_23659 [Tagetes erecta]
MRGFHILSELWGGGEGQKGDNGRFWSANGDRSVKERQSGQADGGIGSSSRRVEFKEEEGSYKDVLLNESVNFEDDGGELPGTGDGKDAGLDYNADRFASEKESLEDVEAGSSNDGLFPTCMGTDLGVNREAAEEKTDYVCQASPSHARGKDGTVGQNSVGPVSGPEPINKSSGEDNGLEVERPDFVNENLEHLGEVGQGGISGPFSIDGGIEAPSSFTVNKEYSKLGILQRKDSVVGGVGHGDMSRKLEI